MKQILTILFLLLLCNIHAQSFSSFVTSGTNNQYVPVLFKPLTPDGGNRTFFISRPGIHENRNWLAHGIVAITGIGYGWGSGGNGLRVDNFTNGFETDTPDSKVINFLGRVVCSSAANEIIVYLRGGTVYFYANAEIVSNTGSYSDPTGQNLNTVSINDPLYNLPKGTYYGSFDINAKTSNFAAIDNGNVGIGVSNPNNKLDVNGTIHAKEVKVDLQNWPDYVFDVNYKQMTLEEVEKYILLYQHLPNIPSAKEVESNGAALGEMSKKFLEKIEELTLYSIEQNKQIKKLQQDNEMLKLHAEELKELKRQIQELISTKK
ncbi:hypothetical protein [uncultured Chryseobacterium sp.]|uniref:hypothetical protein n=1 Tax=uncultured Chryseobacterium sp. TaxID=259322 RepID=UPI0025F96C65|nr:hypothetical protein [uncultured Chryseobacterium sp.]